VSIPSAINVQDYGSVKGSPAITAAYKKVLEKLAVDLDINC
jgi:hypothetical protein